jgi:hypothetical protein
VLPRVATVVLVLITTASVASCGTEEAVADRAAREAFCAQWRALTEVGSRVDDPAVREAIASGAERLRELVPADQRETIDDVVEQARRLAEQADAAGTVDEEAAARAREAYDEAFAKVQEQCEGTLLG